MRTFSLATCEQAMADQRSGESGMTMIEVLVVLSLIAVGAGIVTLTLPSAATGRSLTQEAELFVARLNLAAEQSLIERRQLRMSWSAGGYGFEEWTKDGWQNLKGGALSVNHRFDRDIVLTQGFGTGRGSVTVTPDLFPPEGGRLEWMLRTDAFVRAVTFDGFSAHLDMVKP